MKTWTCCGLLMVATALVVAGCGKEQSPPPAASAPPAAAPSATPSSAPGGYVGALIKGQQSATKGIETSSLTENIQLFNAQEGRYPKDLNELVTKQYLGALPKPPVGMKFTYDSTTGKVAVVPE